MTGTGSDLGHAVRAFRRRRAFTATVLSTFALGIGAKTAVLSLLHILILRDLPVRDPDQLVEPLSLYPGDPRVNSFGDRTCGLQRRVGRQSSSADFFFEALTDRGLSKDSDRTSSIPPVTSSIFQ